MGSATQFRKELDGAVASTNKANSGWSKMSKAAGLAGAALGGVLAVGLEKSIKAAEESQQAQARLADAFKTAHIAMGPLKDAMGAQEAASRKLGFTDDDVRTGLGTLITATHSYRKASQDLSVAEDLARFKHESLATAADTLARATAGSTRAAKELGIIVPKSITEPQEKAAYVIDQTTQRVQGQAQAFSTTAAGGMAQFHAQLNHLEVALGSALLPALGKVAQGLANMVDWLGRNATAQRILHDVADTLRAMFGEVRGVVEHLTQAVQDHRAAFEKLAGFFNTVMVPAFHILGTAAKVGITLMIDAISLGITAISKLIGAAEGAASGVKGAFNAIRTAASNVVGDIAGFFTALPGKIGAAIAAGAGAIKKSITDLFGKVIGWVKDVLGIGSPSTVFHEIGQHVIQGFINGVGSMAGTLKNAVVGMAESLPGRVAGAVGNAGQPGAGGDFHGSSTTDLGKKMAAGLYKWSGPNWDALYKLWTRESGWNPHAENRSSHAYGIAQALPWTKMPKSAWPERAGGQSDASTQIGWGLSYIAGRYGNPAAAWAHELKFGWYDKGGYLPPGLSLALNNTGSPEPVGPVAAAAYGGGNTINVNIGTVIGNDLDRAGRELAEPIYRELLRKDRRNGTLGFR